MENLNNLAKEFLQQYYSTLMGNRDHLINFYNNSSTMTYGGQVYVGLQEVQQKIESFAFKKIMYQLDHQDVQPGPL